MLSLARNFLTLGAYTEGLALHKPEVPGSMVAFLEEHSLWETVGARPFITAEFVGWEAKNTTKAATE